MLVFKFGGASVKDEKAVKNVAEIVSFFPNKEIIIVVSAMGKTTNALEEILNACRNKNKIAFLEKITQLEEYHNQIIKALFSDKKNSIYKTIDEIFKKLRDLYHILFSEKYSLHYDQVVSLGEILSSHILSAYFVEQKMSTNWIDARNLVHTDTTFQEAKVNWKKTYEAINKELLPMFKHNKIVVTQGFIGGTKGGKTSTLGREGSDYSAAIFAFCCNAESVTIWKDVPGMLNADPKYFQNTKKLAKISFKEALELSYYGASVIHPKTIKPLQNKGIPLFIKSFLQPHEEGTSIQENTENDKLIPSFIVKYKQILFSFTPKDFSFIVEENLSAIFKILSESALKINLMQNSALSFSILLDQNKIEKERLIERFQNEYNIKYNDELELITIRHYDEETIKKMTRGKEILVQQRTRHTARFVVKN